MPDELNARQKAFVDHYIKSGFEGSSRNATQAAIAAGYSKKTAYSIGSENLRKPEIDLEIKKREKELAEKNEITISFYIDKFKQYLSKIDDQLDKEFDAAAVNAGRACLETLAKMTGHTLDRIQLNAEVNNRHSVDMIRSLEVDTSSRDAMRLLLDRQRSATLPSGDVQQ